jgi:ferrous iron transport protein B
VGGVIVFLPNIVLLFIAIAFLEDTGYMARAAFIMDRLMHKMGLHGKSFIPMLIGFGCSVPAIMATRMLEDRRDRLTTMMIVPLMSCGARLPIYMLIIPAFFANRVLVDFGIMSIQLHALILWTIYLIGIVLAILLAKVLKLTVFKGEAAPFVMELPPYRMPTLKGLAIHTYERGWMYVRKAGTVILAISVILWALTTFPQTAETKLADLSDEQAQEMQLTNSFAGQIGHALEPALRPMGFDWRIGTALIGAFAAKEVFVAQMGIVFSVGEVGDDDISLREHLQKNYTPLVGLCIMLFCLVSMPCVATIAVTRSESGSTGWAIAQLTGLTVIAYVLTVIVYQTGSALGLG